jgi:gliding motility-associated-like protein
VVIHAAGGVLYNWTPNDRDFISDSTSDNPVVYPFSDTKYQVLVTDIHGCHDTLAVKFFVHSDAIISLPDSVVLYPGESYQMNPQGNVLYYNWSPATGLSATDIANPVSMPDVRTRYIVNGATEWGCKTTDSIDIIVNSESVLDIPNAFSPGSGPNSEFKIVKRGIATLKNFRIFNRWGTMVFETTDINSGWDGTYKGTPQPFGVYVYMVEAYTSTGRKFIKQGNVTLIR